MSPTRQPGSMTTDQLLYVLAERVTNIQQDISTLTDKVDTISTGVNHLDDVERRVTDLEEWKEWTQRLLLGTMVTALAGLITAAAQFIQH